MQLMHLQCVDVIQQVKGMLLNSFYFHTTNLFEVQTYAPRSRVVVLVFHRRDPL